jgi:hypothetical protein
MADPSNLKRMIYYHKPMRNGDQGPSFFRRALYTHLTADSEAELMDFATRVLDMKPEWLQDSGPRFHFDVVGKRLKRLQGHPGAVEVSSRDYIEQLRSKKRGRTNEHKRS